MLVLVFLWGLTDKNVSFYAKMFGFVHGEILLLMMWCFGASLRFFQSWTTLFYIILPNLNGAVSTRRVGEINWASLQQSYKDRGEDAREETSLSVCSSVFLWRQGERVGQVKALPWGQAGRARVCLHACEWACTLPCSTRVWAVRVASWSFRYFSGRSLSIACSKEKDRQQGKRQMSDRARQGDRKSDSWRTHPIALIHLWSRPRRHVGRPRHKKVSRSRWFKIVRGNQKWRPVSYKSSSLWDCGK